MVKLIIWIIVALLVLSFFGISLRTVALSPTAQDNFFFVQQVVVTSWNSFIVWITGLLASLQHSF